MPFQRQSAIPKKEEEEKNDYSQLAACRAGDDGHPLVHGGRRSAYPIFKILRESNRDRQWITFRK